jgi:hypothetical protein
MPVNGRSGYKDKMEQKKPHKHPKFQEIRDKTTICHAYSGQKQLYVMHIQDKNNYMSCIFRTKTTICHAYSGREQGQQHLKTMLK